MHHQATGDVECNAGNIVGLCKVDDSLADILGCLGTAEWDMSRRVGLESGFSIGAKPCHERYP